MKNLFSLLLLHLFSFAAWSQVQFSYTTAADRAWHDQRLIDSAIRRSLQQPLSASTEKDWRGAFWAAELLLHKTLFVQSKLAEAWQKTEGLPEVFQKALLEVSYTLYPSIFSVPASRLLKATSSPAVFVRCAEYLLVGKNDQATRNFIQQQQRQRFGKNNFPGLVFLQERLQQKPAEKRPPLEDLFRENFLPGQTVVFSLQRGHRNFPGLVLIRKGNGQFVRNADGKIFHTTQLARSITNYPYYLTNGNTPQGLFRWTGFDTSTNAYIGPTPNLQLLMPYETTPAVFFGDSSAAGTWTKERYAALLPAGWKTYPALYESWKAGLIGRSEIIMHGTTINPVYYREQSYFPQTPSLGCLCSYEEWDRNGRRTISHQQQIVDAVKGINSSSGYVVVVDLDDRPKAVTLDEVADLIESAREEQEP